MCKIVFIVVFSFLICHTISESSCSHQQTPTLSKCSGCPPTKDGKLCASTTRYFDLTKGACGCGGEPNPKSFWTKSKYTAALNAVNLNPSDPTLGWCPSHCGQCFRICNTGGTTNGKSSGEGECLVIQVENRCGDGYKAYPYFCSAEMNYWDCLSNPSKCQSNDRATNFYGYSAHFDLQDANGQISALGWDNPEVTFEEVACSEGDFGNWSDCYCKEYLGSQAFLSN